MKDKNKVLVVIDMQNDFITGSLGSDAALQTVRPVRDKIIQAHKDGIPIFLTMDSHEDGYLETLEGIKLPVPHCIYGTEGWKLYPVIHGIIDELDGDYVVTKQTFGSMQLPKEIINRLNPSNHLDNKLAEIEVCGLCTDICVMANVAILRSAFPNTIIKVDNKACAGTSPEAHEAALTVMRSIQVDVI